jgi:hypothetical protein
LVLNSGFVGNYLVLLELQMHSLLGFSRIELSSQDRRQMLF